MAPLEIPSRERDVVDDETLAAADRLADEIKALDLNGPFLIVRHRVNELRGQVHRRFGGVALTRPGGLFVQQGLHNLLDSILESTVLRGRE